MTSGVRNQSPISIFPSLPGALLQRAAAPCGTRVGAADVLLENGFLEARIDRSRGLLLSVRNKLTGEEHVVSDDTAALRWRVGEEQENRAWRAEDGVELGRCGSEDGVGRAKFVANVADVAITVEYLLRPDRFWIERRLRLVRPEAGLRLDRLDYGRGAVAGAAPHILELGAFDRPRLLACGEGGLFAGVGWWFYEVSGDGVYWNDGMDYEAGVEFESAPWYVGVFRVEPEEPYAGWSWYRAFLHQQKRERHQRRAWAMWNAGWGQWGVDVDTPDAPRFMALAERLGLDHFGFGSGLSGYGVGESIRLLRETETGRRNLAALREHGLVGGVLAQGNLKAGWEDADAVEGKLTELREFVALPGMRAFSYDFVLTVDTFTAHANLARYFRAAHEVLDYTECHLGMAGYGPQCQREVIVNHPNDLHRFDIARFSADWATLAAFRYSRAEWQRKCDYLMPEAGLYYFATHYSNWGHPRRHTDPEPQQFFYRPHAYTGIGFNFHDHFGFRDALMGALLFSPYLVYGHLDLDMPERDVTFARDLLDWAKGHAELLQEGRVCFEDESACVLSKLRGDGAGLVALFNYNLGRRVFRLRLAADARVRPVYPRAAEPLPIAADGSYEVTVSGESLMLLEVDAALRSDPPANENTPPLDLEHWQREGDSWVTSFTMPDLAAQLAAARDPRLPQKLLCMERARDLGTPVEMTDAEQEVMRIGRAQPVPESYLRAYGFEGATVPTWKIVPWAFADRVWLAYRPQDPRKLSSSPPVAELNGHTLEVVPRVDYRANEVADWTCPLWFADLTPQLHFGSGNELRLANVADTPPHAAIRAAVAPKGEPASSASC